MTIDKKNITGIHGLYRLPDILYQWHRKVPDDIAKVKLQQYTKDIAQPFSPLYDEKKGLELKFGVGKDGAKRLLISSHSIEYLRYSVCQIEGFSHDLIPLPSSNSFIDNDEFMLISPINYTDPREVTRDLRRFYRRSKSPKVIENVYPSPIGLNDDKIYFESTRNDYYDAKKGTKSIRYVVIDLESWEKDHSVTTEVGWSSLKFVNNEPIHESGHILPSENINFKNQTFIIDNKNNFRHGKSTRLSLRDTREFIISLLTPKSNNEQVRLILHGAKNDLVSLDILLKIPKKTYTSDPRHFEIPNGPKVNVIDTVRLMSIIGPISNGISLTNLCNILDVNQFNNAFEVRDYYHNAGNDAYSTLKAFMKIAEGPELERQHKEYERQIKAVITPELTLPQVESEEEEETMEMAL